MKLLKTTSLSAIACAMSVASGALTSTPVVGAPQPAALSDQTVGEAIYNARCSACHGLGGRGTTLPPAGPPLKGNPFIVYGSPAAIATVIRTGRVGSAGRYDEYPDMPSFGGAMISDLRPLIAFLTGNMQSGTQESETRQTRV